ncbi:MAG TPA: pyrroloquinoline quinone biosynthesis protein PqqB [Candidatus Binatia bacterium]|nr:pyrroloquinoline quinone biosynthesis protein PqqB [Candidatus Binatia bacterium]
MLLRVLGSAAGGGFPQWNCGCPNCRGVREGTVPATPRTQESLAVSADGRSWVVLNASPDLRTQIEAFPALRPRARRSTPIAAVVLTNGDVDHVVGLFSLRESQPLVVYATERVRRGLVDGNVLARTLDRFPGHVRWQRLVPGGSTPLVGPDGDTGLVLETVAVPGKPPIHLEGRVAHDPEDNVGVRLRAGRDGGVLAYLPGVGALGQAVHRALAGADVVFFDGTFWRSDELGALGLGTRRAEQMGHVPVGGAAGSLAALAALPARRRLYIHLNNTNPLLRDDSTERAAVASAGWDVAHDGLELEL